MADNQSKEININGDINVTSGDVVAGNKTVSQPHEFSEAGYVPTEESKHPAGFAGTAHGLDVKNGDVVFGDKIIQFFQKNLQIYLFKDVRQLALFLGIFLLVGGGISVGIWYSRQPRKMDGDFNIAVAQFGEITADGSLQASARTEKISNTLFNFLDSEYQGSGLGLTVQVAHRNMPLVTEDTQAEQLAKRINADVVIYGSVYTQNEQAEFLPRFYVNQRAEAGELTGQNELAFPIQFNIAQLSSQDKINTELRLRTEILLNFTKSLIYNSQKDSVSALNCAKTAISVAEKAADPFGGQETLYLLAARIQMAQGMNDDANLMIDKALALNPNYARAYLARGHIYYTQAIQANFDKALLEQALEAYQTAYQLPDQPIGAYIPIKAHTALGNVLVVKAQQTNDSALFAQAVEHFTYVTDEYARTKDPFLRSFASIASFGLGVAYERQGQIQPAIDAYQQAFDLSEDQDFKIRINQQIELIKDR